jgi:hypothetical protein
MVDQAAVGFELGFAGPAQAYTALLPLEVSPAADESGRQVLQLRELDLQLAFEAPGTLREDIEDQPCTVQYPALEFALEVAFLARRQGRREYDQLGLVPCDTGTYFRELAAADEMLRIRTLSGARDLVDHDGASGYCQLRKFLAFGFVWCTVRARVYEYCSFTALRTFKQIEPPPPVKVGIA